MICHICGTVTDDRIGYCINCGRSKKHVFKLLLLIPLLFFIGCSTTKTTVTETTEKIKIDPDPIEFDQVPVTPVNLDSIALNNFAESFTDSSLLKVEAETPTGNVTFDIKPVKDDKGKVKKDKKGLPVFEATGKADPKPTEAERTIKEKKEEKQLNFLERLWKTFNDFLYYIIIGAVILGLIIFFIKK